MRRVTITIDFYTDAEGEDIMRLAADAEVQILEPAGPDGERAEFSTRDVTTTIVTTAP